MVKTRLWMWEPSYVLKVFMAPRNGGWSPQGTLGTLLTPPVKASYLRWRSSWWLCVYQRSQTPSMLRPNPSIYPLARKHRALVPWCHWRICGLHNNNIGKAHCHRNTSTRNKHITKNCLNCNNLFSLYHLFTLCLTIYSANRTEPHWLLGFTGSQWTSELAKALHDDGTF